MRILEGISTNVQVTPFVLCSIYIMRSLTLLSCSWAACLGGSAA